MMRREKTEAERLESQEIGRVVLAVMSAIAFAVALIAHHPANIWTVAGLGLAVLMIRSLTAADYIAAMFAFIIVAIILA